MSYGTTGGDFDRLLADTLRAISLRPGGPDADGTPPEVRGLGEGLDGLVQVVAKPGGRLESLAINPRAMRSDSQTLAEEILAAVNLALADLQDKLGAAVPGQVDRAALLNRLRDLQESALPRMQSFLQAVEDARARVSREPGSAG